ARSDGNQVLFNASHAARCTARHGVRSHAVPVALVGECPISLLWNVARRRWKALLRSQRGSYGRATSISRRISWSSSSFPARTIFHTGAKEPSPHGEFTQIIDRCVSNVLYQTRKGKSECRKKLRSRRGWRSRRRC